VGGLRQQACLEAIEPRVEDRTESAAQTVLPPRFPNLM